jgi:hypothetical protein
MMKTHLIILTALALTGCGSITKKEQMLYKCKLHAEDNLKNPISDSHYHNYIELCMRAEGYKRKWNATCDFKTNPLIDGICFE